jgi:hypothetical protein
MTIPLVEYLECSTAAGADSKVCQDYALQEEEPEKHLMSRRIQMRKLQTNIYISKLVAQAVLPMLTAVSLNEFITTVSNMLPESRRDSWNSHVTGYALNGHQVR